MPADLSLPYGLCFYGTLLLLALLCLVVLFSRRASKSPVNDDEA